MRNIVIIGGGFSGAMVAVHMARLLRGPAKIEIIEPRATLGAGVAYSAADPAHRINVPAARMTVFSDDPAHFDRWLRTTQDTRQADPDSVWADGSAFPNRGVFGHYIATLVHEAAHARPGVTITHRRTSATGVDAHPHGHAVHLATGETLPADLVVLAVSHPPPMVPAVLRAARAAGAPIIADPWQPGALVGIAAQARILVVGTGLTMADVIGTLDRQGHTGPITALSRRGLLSRGHVFGDIAKRERFAAMPPPRTAAALTRAVRAQVRAAADEGAPWQAVFDDVRTHAPRLWNALPEAEQRRVVRHLRPFWDVHRFRVAPQLEAAIAQLKAAGQLSVQAASLVGAEWDGRALAVRVAPRRAANGDPATHVVDAVVVTTGPAHGSAVALNPALAALARQGLVQPDRVGLGLLVDTNSHPIGIDGAARPDLLVAGPLARGRFGELMGLPQVSEHALDVARTAVTVLEERYAGSRAAAAL